jgi:AcrR family transcriptional regulator
MAARGSNTKERVARAALQLFVEKGVGSTTVRDIAAAAGVAEGSLYRHYESKEALAWDLFASAFTELAAELERLQKTERTLRAKVGAMIRHFCAFFDRDRTLFSYLLLSQHSQLRRVTAEMPHPINVLQRVIHGGMRRGEIPRGDPNLATSMVMGLVLQAAVDRVYGRVRQDLTRLADVLVAAAWRVLEA